MSLLDRSGCLSEAGLAAVTAAVPGQIPSDVAAHLAACARCQERVLSGGAPRPSRKGVLAAPPSLGRIVVLMALAVLSIIIFFWTLRRLVG